MAVFYTAEQIASLPSYNLGESWNSAPDLNKLRAIETTELIWKSISFRASPFNSDFTGRSPLFPRMEAAFLYHARQILETNGSVSDPIPEDILALLKPFTSNRVLSINATRSSTGGSITGGGIDRSEVLALVQSWAQEGNTDLIPDSKLPSTIGGGGGLNENQVRALISDINNIPTIPRNKLSSQLELKLLEIDTNASNITSLEGLTASLRTSVANIPTLPTFPASGSRASKFPFFIGDVLNWTTLNANFIQGLGIDYRQLTNRPSIQMPAAWAIAGNTAAIPASKLTNAPSGGSSGGGGGISFVTLTGTRGREATTYPINSADIAYWVQLSSDFGEASGIIPSSQITTAWKSQALLEGEGTTTSATYRKNAAGTTLDIAGRTPVVLAIRSSGGTSSGGSGTGTSLPAHNQAETRFLGSRAGSLFWEAIYTLPDPTEGTNNHYLKVRDADSGIVAFEQISYNELKDRPAIPDLSSYPTTAEVNSAISRYITKSRVEQLGISYTSLSDKPRIPDVSNFLNQNQIDSRITSLVNKNLIDGLQVDYRSLSNRPTIPTNVAQLEGRIDSLEDIFVISDTWVKNNEAHTIYASINGSPSGTTRLRLRINGLQSNYVTFDSQVRTYPFSFNATNSGTITRAVGDTRTAQLEYLDATSQLDLSHQILIRAVDSPSTTQEDVAVAIDPNYWLTTNTQRIIPVYINTTQVPTGTNQLVLGIENQVRLIPYNSGTDLYNFGFTATQAEAVNTAIRGTNAANYTLIFRNATNPSDTSSSAGTNLHVQRGVLIGRATAPSTGGGGGGSSFETLFDGTFNRIQTSQETTDGTEVRNIQLSRALTAADVGKLVYISTRNPSITTAPPRVWVGELGPRWTSIGTTSSNFSVFETYIPQNRPDSESIRTEMLTLPNGSDATTLGVDLLPNSSDPQVNQAGMILRIRIVN